MIKPPPLPNYLSLEQVMPLMFVNAKCLNFDFDIIFLSGSIKNMFLFVMTNWSSFFFVYNPKKDTNRKWNDRTQDNCSYVLARRCIN